MGLKDWSDAQKGCQGLKNEVVDKSERLVRGLLLESGIRCG